MGNLVIAFCCFRPKQYTEKMNDFREIEHLSALKQLQRVMLKNFDLLIINNTKVKNDKLMDFLDYENYIEIHSNTGTKNKGIGELAMLQRLNGKGMLNKYEKIIYFGGRNLITSSHIFEKTNSMTSDALVSNAPYMYLNGDFMEAHDELYNTNAFAMKRDILQRFSDSIDFEYMLMAKMGVEQMLYEFIHKNSINYKEIEWLGIIRNDWQRTGKLNNIRNYHIC